MPRAAATAQIYYATDLRRECCVSWTLSADSRSNHLEEKEKEKWFSQWVRERLFDNEEECRWAPVRRLVTSVCSLRRPFMIFTGRRGGGGYKRRYRFPKRSTRLTRSSSGAETIGGIPRNGNDKSARRKNVSPKIVVKS
ncbi:hypothetical protein J6590_001203 [Homalodisca vitripennis]|nr:hypothetical protein J6590_001203 [Homalodisca vitripennis]